MVQGGVNETVNQVCGAWPRSSNAHSRTARGAGIAFRSKNSTLLVTRLDISDSFGVGEGQVYLNGSSSRVCKDMAHDLPLKGLHEDIDAFAGLIGAKTGDESSGGRVGKGGGGTSNGSRVRSFRGEEGARDSKGVEAGRGVTTTGEERTVEPDEEGVVGEGGREEGSNRHIVGGSVVGERRVTSS
ncbi:hypothetical protein CDL15_Pgr009010 [Punica granatum]|uniref:Uncharacterized protein n=1 Tax=Punica granatum TaxID=22663 RepID=A0A218VZD7_PUNGR|nr:hypothetical protein CDL15_Pgr009010 [Punica granatum]